MTLEEPRLDGSTNKCSTWRTKVSTSIPPRYFIRTFHALLPLAKYLMKALMLHQEKNTGKRPSIAVAKA